MPYTLIARRAFTWQKQAYAPGDQVTVSTRLEAALLRHRKQAELAPRLLAQPLAVPPFSLPADVVPHELPISDPPESVPVDPFIPGSPPDDPPVRRRRYRRRDLVADDSAS